MENGQNPRDIVDTTDSLEAVGACRSMKNFLFIVMLLGLLLTQMIFWMDRLGLVEQKAGKACGSGKVCCPAEKPVVEPAAQPSPAPPAPAGPLPLTAAVNVAREVEKVAEQVEPDQPTDQPESSDTIVVENPQDPAAPAEQPSGESAGDQTDVAALFRISANFARGLVMICNFTVLAAAILYSLTLLMCLKISLTGRLGGVNHIARAFFISLFLLVLLVPWQRVLPGVLVGTVWLPKELLCGGWAKAHESAFWKVLFYLRFCGLWLLAVWFLLWAQTRSAKWARATLRRLGVVR